MKISQMLTDLGNAVRSASSKNSKFTIAEMSSEVLGLVNPNNFFSYQLPAFNDNGIKSVQKGKAQRFNAPWKGELISPEHAITLDVTKGDEVTQSIFVKTDGELHDLTYNFADGHPIRSDVVKITDGYYKAVAAYTVPFTGKLRLLTWWANTPGGTYIEVSSPYAAITKVGGVVHPNLIADPINTDS